MPLWLFAFLAALAVISALGVVVQRNPIHCLLALVLTLLVLAVLFIGLDAVVIGFLQAIVYAGAIMVLFLFVIWLLNLQMGAPARGSLAPRLLGAVAIAALVAELFVFSVHAPAAQGAPSVVSGYGSIDSLAASLFADYLVAFEVTSVLLLAAVVGAVALARRMPAAAAGASPQSRPRPGPPPSQQVSL